MSDLYYIGTEPGPYSSKRKSGGKEREEQKGQFSSNIKQEVLEEAGIEQYQMLQVIMIQYLCLSFYVCSPFFHFLDFLLLVHLWHTYFSSFLDFLI